LRGGRKPTYKLPFAEKSEKLKTTYWKVVSVVDSENINGASYSDDLDMCLRLTEALIRLQEILEQNPVRSPAAIVAYNTVLFGLIPNINVNCPHDKECQVSTGVPVGGFLDALECLDEAISILRLEVDYDGGSYTTSQEG